MKLGLLVYDTKNGLGYQTYNLYKYLKPYKTMLVDLSKFNGLPLQGWYKPTITTDGVPKTRDIEKFLDGLDAVFVCETPLNYELFSEARKRGIKTILQPNFEFLDYMVTPGLPQPDIFALPSLWNVKQYDAKNFNVVAHLSVPVDGEKFKQRTIKEAYKFFHIAGNPAVHDRNGTMDFIHAVKLAEPHAKLKYRIYLQKSNQLIESEAHKQGIEVVKGVENNAEMYEWGDVLVLPRRYGGLCLPAQEAVYCGIPVMMPDIDPNNRWLPQSWLVPTTVHIKTFISRSPIKIYNVNVAALAQKMLDWSRRNIEGENVQALQIGTTYGWDQNVSRYLEFIKNVH